MDALRGETGCVSYRFGSPVLEYGIIPGIEEANRGRRVGPAGPVIKGRRSEMHNPTIRD